MNLVLEQDDSAVSGTYSGTYGTRVELSGTVDEGQVMLHFTAGRVGEITYEGVLLGDTMSGYVTYGTSLSGPFEGYRRPPVTWLSTVVGYSVLAMVFLVALWMALSGSPGGPTTVARTRQSTDSGRDLRRRSRH